MRKKTSVNMERNKTKCGSNTLRHIKDHICECKVCGAIVEIPKECYSKKEYNEIIRKARHGTK